MKIVDQAPARGMFDMTPLEQALAEPGPITLAAVSFPGMPLERAFDAWVREQRAAAAPWYRAGGWSAWRQDFCPEFIRLLNSDLDIRLTACTAHLIAAVRGCELVEAWDRLACYLQQQRIRVAEQDAVAATERLIAAVQRLLGEDVPTRCLTSDQARALLSDVEWERA